MKIPKRNNNSLKERLFVERVALKIIENARQTSKWCYLNNFTSFT